MEHKTKSFRLEEISRRFIRKRRSAVCSCRSSDRLFKSSAAYTFVGDIEPFYCETLTYIDNLKSAGIEAKVDVYPNCFHAFDMLTPFRKVSKEAIAKFEKEYLNACEKYFAEQNECSKT